MTVKKKKKYISVPHGIFHVYTTPNNTIITLTDPKGATLTWASAGMFFKGTRKSSQYAAQLVAKHISVEGKKFNVNSIDIKCKYFYSGREASIKMFKEYYTIRKIIDVTPIPHGGVRPPKARSL